MTRPGIASDWVVTFVQPSSWANAAPWRGEAEHEGAAERRPPGEMRRVRVLPISHAFLPHRRPPRLAIDRGGSRIEARRSRDRAAASHTRAMTATGPPPAGPWCSAPPET